MRRQTLLITGGSLIVACAGACGAQSTGEHTGGMGVPQQRGPQEYAGERRAIETRVHVAANGCFLGSWPHADGSHRYLVVWPADTEQGPAGDELRLTDGSVVRDRDVLAGDGMLMPTRELEGFGADGYWDSAVGFCTPEASEVLVLDSAEKA